MPTTGFVFPSSGASVARSGSFGTAWANPGNILSDDTTNATMAYSGSGNSADLFTEFLEGTFPSLGLPPGATINGIEVTIRAQKVSGPSNKNFFIALVETGAGVQIGTFSANLTTSLLYYTFGDLSTPAGVTATDLNSGSFKLRLSLQNSSSWSGIGTPVAGIDSIAFNVDYSIPSGVPGDVKVYSGSEFTQRPLMVWDGSEWRRREVRYWDGSAWVLS